MLTTFGVLLLNRHPTLGKRIIWVALIGFAVAGMPAVSSALIVSLERNLPVAAGDASPPGAIVVLGGEVVRTEGDSVGARVGPLTLERLRAAAELHRKTDLPIIVSGGTTQTQAPAVGTLMAASLSTDFRTPVAWTEAKSRDTWENAAFSAEILRAQGIKSVYVVTHAWHMRRALIAFAPTGLAVIAAPTPLDKPAGPIASDFMPRVTGWETTYFALHEWIGCAWYALR
jgi:uncharacterized SAM-binding protein YcdF (DUF218 family)